MSKNKGLRDSIQSMTNCKNRLRNYTNALEQLEADSNQNILTIKSSMEQHKQNLLDQITTLRSDSIQSLKDETKRLEGTNS